MPIPGYKELLEKDHYEEKQENNDNILFLLMGPGRCGKTLYCKTFFESHLKTGNIGIFLSSTLTKRQYQNLFNGLSNIRDSNSFFINPFLREQINPNELNSSELNNRLRDIKKEIDKIIFFLKVEQKNQHFSEKNRENNLPSLQQKRIFMVIDSLSHLFNIFDEKEVLRFINALAFSLKNNNILSIFTIDDTVVERTIIDKIRPVFDGVLQMKLDEKEDEVVRQIKFLSLTGFSLNHTSWIKFEVDKNSLLSFPNSSTVICSVCKASIKTKPVFYLDMAFHEHHLELYKKLSGIYGISGISDLGLSSVIYANFFFIDIVGLSSPRLSVKKQIEKIEFLNNFVVSSEIFRKNSDKKILPTGDGMAIGFISNPEAPLNLSIQLHSKLKKHNIGKDDESTLAVRIGIASGTVFIVNDANNNQNIWGPGIIFARRVMDLGDNNHILIDGGLAHSLITLDDKYKEIIHYIGDYQIKHGQIIKLYSAYKENYFGNKDIPVKMKCLPL
ncbi:MAG TPA: ATPase domain-containing protein [Nitrososphaeraceae archaeon]|nr:ATPase domain-containing protein [Nitrososphaeraceae archaeon]